VADAASVAKASAAEISVKANAGQDLVARACGAMDEIQEATEAIAKILEVIDGIAFQTNLLALNAGVEAARAGDSGRGFAVVAAEVRALAQRSSDAARDIAGLIETSDKVVASGVTLVRESGSALEQIVHSVDEIETKTKSIATAASSAAIGVSEITTATGNLDSATQQNAAMFEQTNAAVQSLQAEATVLANLASTFQVTNRGQAVCGDGDEVQDEGPLTSNVA
jgi:methyl-accepting chemotaxis protein